MSVAAKLTRLSDARDAIITALGSQGVTATGHGFEDFADDIGDIDTSVPYTGSYTFTPSDSTQTISISGLTASQDITINPVPNTYGHITWNGNVLTVS